MSLIGQTLFHRGRLSLSDFLRQRMASLPAAVDSISESEFSAKSDDEIAEIVASRERISPLEINYDAAVATVDETDMDVRGAFGETARVAGLKATKSIPFTGSRDLWDMSPSTYGASAPYGEVRGQKLTVGISVRTEQSDDAKRHIDQTVGQIRQYLEWQKTEIEAHNAALKANVFPAITKRRARLSTKSDLLKRL